MSILTGKLGSVYVIDASTAEAAEATTEEGASMIYQVTNADHRILNPNIPVVLSTGDFDKSYFDNGVNWFEGKVKLLTTGEGALTLAIEWVTLQQVGEAFGWVLNLNQDIGEITKIGDAWKANMPLGKSASITLSRYRSDVLLDQKDFSGYQECGLAGKTPATATGLAGVTQYFLKINLNGAGIVEYDFTTVADMTYAAVIILINTALAAVDCECGLVGGDLRFTSYKDGPGSSIALSAGQAPDFFDALTDWTAFDTAVDGSYNDQYVLLKLFEDGDSGYWAKALRSAFSVTKAINAIDQEALTFEADSRVSYFEP